MQYTHCNLCIFWYFHSMHISTTNGKPNIEKCPRKLWNIGERFSIPKKSIHNFEIDYLKCEILDFFAMSLISHSRKIELFKMQETCFTLYQWIRFQIGSIWNKKIKYRKCVTLDSITVCIISLQKKKLENVNC